MTKFTDDYFRTIAHDFMWQNSLEHSSPGTEEALYLLLKEVAKDVRHACAEMRVEFPMVENTFRGVNDKHLFQLGQQAHADACMNS